MRVIRAIFTDGHESLWQVWLNEQNQPYKIKVYDLIWREPNGFPSGYWTVGELNDTMSIHDIGASADEFKSALNSLIEHADE
tara:strand:+ start:118 stop:363 length:246 start_codon:yes stop_codon:yes gene_type:complete